MTRKITAAILLWLSIIFGYFYYVGYWERRDCFNEMGRCFDADSGVVYLEQSGAIWLFATVLAFGSCLYQLLRLGYSKR